MIPRDRASPPTSINTITKDVHDAIIEDGKHNHKLWSDANYSNASHVNSFRSEVKKHYYWHQKTRCCYCSYPLQPHGRVYDAEHIIDKSGFPEFMFLVENLAVACVICNSHKSAKSVFIKGLPRPASVPNKSEDYRIVHPHLDEWTDHLRFDNLGRVSAANGSKKGSDTMDICGIEALNFLALANEFAPSCREAAYELMCTIVTYTDSNKIKATLEMMENLAETTPAAVAVVETLRAKFLKP